MYYHRACVLKLLWGIILASNFKDGQDIYQGAGVGVVKSRLEGAYLKLIKLNFY